jgi:hypothetical protein
MILDWRDVLTNWCTPRETAAPAGVPVAYREFLAAGGRSALSCQNRFVVPQADGDWMIFYVECQAVCRWAYRADDSDPDPQVYIADAGDTTFRPVGLRLDAFLSAAGTQEAVVAAPFGRSGSCHPDDLDPLIGQPRMPVPHLGWPECEVVHYAGPDVLAFAHVVQDDLAFAFIAGRTREALAAFDARSTKTSSWESTD